MARDSYVTRLSYNRSEWRRPTGDARSQEAGTHNQEHGFGYEDWLFRSEWLIAGWRYAFIHGVWKSHKKLIEAAQPFDVTLFTIQPDKRRRYVCTIRSLECLDDRQAEEALREFRRRGWLNIMRQEINDVDGNSSTLDKPNSAKDVLSVRFRVENVALFLPEKYVDASDPVGRLKRYTLVSEENLGRAAKEKATIAGSPDLPTGTPFSRPATAATECTPEHARMQAQLMRELQAEYPSAKVVREADFVDVSVRTETELRLYEIKSDLEPRRVIREALGQILEYAFHPRRPASPLALRLVIVGRRTLCAEDRDYMNRLRTDFNLPIEYRVVSI